MKRYAQIVNEAVVRAFILPPKQHTTETGTIVNFDRLPDADLATYGFYLIVDERIAGQEWQQKGPDLFAIVGLTVVVTATLTDIPLVDYKQQVIKKAYAATKALLDVQAEGYSQAEIATWPTIQADVTAYNADNLDVGMALQSAADTSAYTVSKLAAMLTPRIEIQVTAIADRAAQVVAIMAAATHSEV